MTQRQDIIHRNVRTALGLSLPFRNHKRHEREGKAINSGETLEMDPFLAIVWAEVIVLTTTSYQGWR